MAIAGNVAMLDRGTALLTQVLVKLLFERLFLLVLLLCFKVIFVFVVEIC